MKRPITTLILPISTDGKLVSRDGILTDPSPAWRTKPHVIGYLQQFFEISPTSAYTLTSGNTIALSGVNNQDGQTEQSDLNLVVLDSKHALTQSGRKYLKQSVHKLIIIDDPLSPAEILKFLAGRGVA